MPDGQTVFRREEIGRLLRSGDVQRLELPFGTTDGPPSWRHGKFLIVAKQQRNDAHVPLVFCNAKIDYTLKGRGLELRRAYE